jgi:hypothetical protein
MSQRVQHKLPRIQFYFLHCVLVRLIHGVVHDVTDLSTLRGENPSRRRPSRILQTSLDDTTQTGSHRSVVRPGFDTPDVAPSIWSRLAALVSLALWFGVGLAGRTIGSFGTILF